jgi:hypothetical protein
MATQSPVPPSGDPGVPPGVSVPDMRTPDAADDEHAELVGSGPRYKTCAAGAEPPPGKPCPAQAAAPGAAGARR